MKKEINNENLIRGLLEYNNIKKQETEKGERYFTKYWTVILNDKSVSFKNSSGIFILQLNKIKVNLNHNTLNIKIKGQQKLEIEIVNTE